MLNPYALFIAMRSTLLALALLLLGYSVAGACSVEWRPRSIFPQSNFYCLSYRIPPP